MAKYQSKHETEKDAPVVATEPSVVLAARPVAPLTNEERDDMVRRVNRSAKGVTRNGKAVKVVMPNGRAYEMELRPAHQTSVVIDESMIHWITLV